ncbi:MAG: synthase delta subunit [Oscillospiraceae bacterium]|nr:synthase delta subunit [Oscillospiraceae bacterium]
MSIVDKRYAEALFRIALQENAINTYQEELVAVSGLYETNGEFRNFLLYPQYDGKLKKQVLNTLFEHELGKNMLNFLMLLLDKNRITLLPTISREFVRLADEHNRVLNITIFAAIPMEAEDVKKVCDKFQALYHASDVKATVELDSSLIGGIKVAVGDKLYDASIKGRLSELLSAMSV